MKRAPLVWLVDSDPVLRGTLYEHLAGEFEVRLFPDGRMIERRLARERPELLLLGNIGSDDDGLYLCRRLRDAGDDVPLILLADANDAEIRISAIENGADDYLGKPVVARELSARMNALLRRRGSVPAATTLNGNTVIQLGDCRLDLVAGGLFRGSYRLPTTSGEFSLLMALARNPHRAMTRERLLELVRGPGVSNSSRSIDVQISRLRKLLETDPSSPQFIQTVWGYGYVFRPGAVADS